MWQDYWSACSSYQVTLLFPTFYQLFFPFLPSLFVCLFNTIMIAHWNSNNIPFVIRMNSVMKIITPKLNWIRKSRFNIESLLNQIIIIIFEIMPINPKFNKRLMRVIHELIKILINRRLKTRRIVTIRLFGSVLYL